MILSAITLLSSQAIFADDAETKKLAALAQNPIANAISLPLQYNYNDGYGSDHNNNGSILNIQPVIPFKVGQNWNLITRTIIPVVDLPINNAGDSKSGIGDINLALFMSPSKMSGSWIWGAGFVTSFDSASNDSLGAGKTSMGPTAIALTSSGPWTYGALAQNIWDVSGDDDRADVNAMLLNPFINYNIPKSGGWYLTAAPNITANWEADSGDRWTVPIGGGVGKVFKIGKQAVNAKLAYYKNIETVTGGPDDQVQFQFTLLFPK